MNELIQDLKNNHDLIGLKSEFEDEGATLDEVLWLLSVSDDNEVDFTVKLGGCAAVRDMKDVRDIGVSEIVAPMIESPYALRKFVLSSNAILGKNHNIRLSINIETQNALRELDKILIHPTARRLSNIIIGRSDLAGSYEPIINPQLLMKNIAETARKITLSGISCMIGGRIKADSVNFLRQLGSSIKGFETRKCVFKVSDKSMNPEAINKALQFELDWAQKVGDVARVEEIKKRLS